MFLYCSSFWPFIHPFIFSVKKKRIKKFFCYITNLKIFITDTQNEVVSYILRSFLIVTVGFCSFRSIRWFFFNNSEVSGVHHSFVWFGLKFHTGLGDFSPTCVLGKPSHVLLHQRRYFHSFLFIRYWNCLRISGSYPITLLNLIESRSPSSH